MRQFTILLLFLSIGQHLHADVQYTVTGLGVVPAEVSLPGEGFYQEITPTISINNSGQIVGSIQVGGPGGVSHAAILTPGAMADLGTNGGTQSWASGITASGQVVGTYQPAGQSNSRAFTYQNGQFTDLPSLFSPPQTEGLAVNAPGQIVGDSGGKAFFYSNGTMKSIDPAGTTSFGSAISKSGLTVGFYTQFDAHANVFDDYGFLYNQATNKTTLLTINVVPAQYVGVFPHGVNDKGEIVGEIAGSLGNHAFYYFNDVFTTVNDPSGPLDHGSTWLMAINTNSVGVGGSNFSGAEHAVLYQNGLLTNLNGLIDPSSGWKLRNADDINDLGQIVGVGIDPQGQTEEFLLSPVPEPTAPALMTGLCSVALLGRRQVRIHIYANSCEAHPTAE
jgi:probable HAF family extracellular repeat protein